jgi:hypothetical protein
LNPFSKLLLDDSAGLVTLRILFTRFGANAFLFTWNRSLPMPRRTVLVGAIVALAGCQGTSSPMNSAFKMPTPSFNILAPYGSPRIPPPGTHSYGQPGLLPPAAASTTPYYPASARGVSQPQTPEAESVPSETSSKGKVAAAVWRKAEWRDDGESNVELVAYESNREGVVRIPGVSVHPDEPVELKLKGMKAHDLTGAVAGNAVTPGVMLGMPPALNVASLPLAAAVGSPITRRQVIYTTAPAASSATTVTTTAGSSSGRLVEMTDLPATKSDSNLERVRGFDQPSITISPAADVFIAPQMTISASTRETRDAVAAAVLKAEAPASESRPSQPASGWKSRYSIDES